MEGDSVGDERVFEDEEDEGRQNEATLEVDRERRCVVVVVEVKVTMVVTTELGRVSLMDEPVERRAVEGDELEPRRPSQRRRIAETQEVRIAERGTVHDGMIQNRGR